MACITSTYEYYTTGKLSELELHVLTKITQGWMEKMCKTIHAVWYQAYKGLNLKKIMSWIHTHMNGNDKQQIQDRDYLQGKIEGSEIE